MKTKILTTLLLAASVAWGQIQRIQYPDIAYYFDFETDDFETHPFWCDKKNCGYSANATAEASVDTAVSKVAMFTYVHADPVAELRFCISRAVRMEIEYDQYIPSNYDCTDNHKGLMLFGGAYGVFNSDITLSNENWPDNVAGKAKVSFNYGFDRQNFGHNYMTPLTYMWEYNQGSWQHNHFYLELAKNPSDTGIYQIYRNGQIVMDSRMVASVAGAEHIGYATTGNRLTEGYFMGWSNGFTADTLRILIDNLLVKYDTTFQNDNYAKRKKWHDIYVPVNGMADTVFYPVKNIMQQASLHCRLKNTTGVLADSGTVPHGDSATFKCINPGRFDVTSRRAPQ